MEKAYQTIVVGVDFTPCSRIALQQALRLTATNNARVHVVHVIDTAVAMELEEALSPTQQYIREGLMADSRQAWLEFAKNTPGAVDLPISISVEHRVLGLLKNARESKADLLVLGAFGTQPADVGVGTVATACVRTSPCDVLLVRDVQEGPFKVIVAAVDFSKTSARALQRAAEFAVRNNSDLHVLHVLDPPWVRLFYRGPSVGDLPNLTAQYKSLLEGRLQRFVETVLDRVQPPHLTCALFESPSHRSGIMEYADRVGAQLVCLGTRGRSNVRDILMGSTAEKALASSQCSVLAVKSEDGDQEPALR